MYFPANDFWLWPVTTTVVTVLDVAPATVLAGYHRSWRDRLQNKLQMRRLGAVAEKIVTISEYSSRQIQQAASVPVEKVNVVHCGVSSKYCPPPSGKPRGDFILYVGGFDRRKNLERLLDAYALMRGSGYDGRLVMAGHSRPGGYVGLYYDMPALLKIKNLTDAVDLIENPTDEMIIKLYQTAKVFIFPSIIEGFGLPVLEAMSCGCPVACSSATSLPEVGGDAVVYFDSHDVTDMAKTTARLMNDEVSLMTLANRGVQRADAFKWTKAAKALRLILSEAYL